VQSFDFLGVQGDGHVTPAEADVGVMAFGTPRFELFLCAATRFFALAMAVSCEICAGKRMST
jgi:hypothetical protein